MNQSRDVFPPDAELLPAAVGTLGTVVPAGCSIEIASLMIVNHDAAAHTFTLYVHRSTSVPAAGNAICVAVPINGNTIYQFAGPIIIPAGWQLSGLADVASVVGIFMTGYIFNEVY
jgi:hypothetical protein